MLLLGLVLLAFASVADVVLASIGQPHTKLVVERGPARSSPLSRLLGHARLADSAIVVARGAAFLLVAISSVMLAVGAFGLSPATLAASAAGVLLVVALVEVTFRTLAGRRLETAARLIGATLEMMVMLLTPFARFLEAVADIVLLGTKVGGAPPSTDEHPETTPMLPSKQGEERTGEDERKMIRGVFEMELTSVSQIMVPRVDIAAIEASTPFQEAISFVIEQGYSRIPLYEDTIDNIVGMIYAKDLLKTLRLGNPEVGLKRIAHPALFVPEYKKIDELLREFRQKKVHIAIVVDEYGGTEGLVTIEDLLEQIVGEIEDEYDTEEREVELVSEREAIVDAKVGIEDINELFGLSLEAEDFDTVGGMLSARLGHIPVVGDTVQTDGVTFSVLSATGKRVKKVKVIRNESPGEGEKQPE
ncbi:MAG: hemolysin family protein [Dehalococcoidia bacterium]|nr:hemolysin family protein [Dehalococcoidia bacterium]